MSKSVLFAALAVQPGYTSGQAEDGDLPRTLRGRAFYWQSSLAKKRESDGFVVEQRDMSQEEANYINSRKPVDLDGAGLVFEQGDDLWIARPYQDSELQPGLVRQARKAVAKYSPPVQISGFQILPGPATNDISGIESELLTKAIGTLRLRKRLDAYWTQQTALYRVTGAKPSEAGQRRLDRLAVLLAKTAQPASFVENLTAFMEQYLPGFSPNGAANRARFGVAGVDDVAEVGVVSTLVAIPVAYWLYAALIALAGYYISYQKAFVALQRADVDLTKKMADICSDPKASAEARAATCAYVKDHKPPEPTPDFTDLIMWGGIAVVGLFSASIVLPGLADSARDAFRGRHD
jgi:hypothetical protein